MNKVIFLLLLSLVLLPLHVFPLSPVAVGEWIPIKDVKDPHIVAIGKFAVTTYDKENKAGPLTFTAVVRGEYQIVSGVNYRLVVAADSKARGNGPSKYYEAIVLEKPWLKSLNLTSFTPLLKNHFL